MKVFISWSGELSKRAAILLHEYLPFLVPTVIPYMSAKDIEMGERWSADVAAELEVARYGILCITRSNAGEPWVNFEAGALSKALDDARVCPLLLDLRPAELDRRSPLLQFQAATLEPEQMWRLVEALNRASSAPRSPEYVQRSFGMWWPELQQKLNAAIREAGNQHVPPLAASISKPRTEVMLEELLELVREQVRRQSHVEVPVPQPPAAQPIGDAEHHLPRTIGRALQHELHRLTRLASVSGSDAARQRRQAMSEIQRHAWSLGRRTRRNSDEERLLAEARAVLEKHGLQATSTFRTLVLPVAARADLQVLIERALRQAGARRLEVDAMENRTDASFSWEDGPAVEQAHAIGQGILDEHIHRAPRREET